MIKIICGDITSRPTDAIVNAANTYLLMGGGVCGAIRFVAGPELERECRENGDCPTAEARITAAYGLPCKHVIHAAAPRYLDGNGDKSEFLRRCYQSIFVLTAKYQIKSIVIPAIGTGIYRYPIKKATKIAIDTALVAHKKQKLLVEFVCFDENTATVYEETYPSC